MGSRKWNERKVSIFILYFSVHLNFLFSYVICSLICFLVISNTYKIRGNGIMNPHVFLMQVQLLSTPGQSCFFCTTLLNGNRIYHSKICLFGIKMTLNWLFWEIADAEVLKTRVELTFCKRNLHLWRNSLFVRYLSLSTRKKRMTKSQDSLTSGEATLPLLFVVTSLNKLLFAFCF